MIRKRIWQIGLAVPVALLLVGLAAPYVRADRYGEDIRNGLQGALGRKVEILGKVTFNLFSGPGFTIGKVVVYDDASAGIEPFALVDQLQARVNLAALLVGRLEFSKVLLVDPYVNLVKREGVPWNVAPLLRRAPVEGKVSLPEIEISGGRFNFKFGDTKSAFYLNNADVTLTRSSKVGIYEVRVYGEPSRTDRAARGFGSLRGKGTWTTGTESKLDLDIELERSGIDEIATLIRGDAVGVHGIASAKLKIAGPVSHLDIRGQVHMEDIHRWDLLQTRSAGGWKLNVVGSFDLDRQALELSTSQDAPAENRRPAGSPAPQMQFTAFVKILGLLSVPVLTAGVEVSDLPAPTLIEVARHMGAPLVGGLDLQGNVSGSLSYSEPTGISGHLDMADAAMRVGDNSLLRVPNASLNLVAGSIHLLPSTLVGDAGQEALVEATYTPETGAVQATITGKGLRIADLQGKAGGLLGGRALPMADRFSGGVWSGRLQYAQPSTADGEWSGAFNVRDTSASISGIAEPVKLSVARVEVAGNHLAVRGMRAKVGSLECFGEYRYDFDEDRPHRFDISILKADIGEFERLFQPTLSRETNFLSRTLRLRQPVLPEWLQVRRASGIIRVGTLTMGETSLRAVRSTVLWTGSTVQFNKIGARLGEGLLAGTANIKVGGSQPEYQLRGSIQNMAWHNGKLDVNGQLATAGSGTDLLLNLTSAGAFQARGLLLPTDTLRTASGTFELHVNRSGPQMKLTSVQAALGTERFAGEGATQPDGRLNIELASASRSVHLSGPMLPLKLELVEKPSAR